MTDVGLPTRFILTPRGWVALVGILILSVGCFIWPWMSLVWLVAFSTLLVGFVLEWICLLNGRLTVTGHQTDHHPVLNQPFLLTIGICPHVWWLGHWPWMLVHLQPVDNDVFELQVDQTQVIPIEDEPGLLRLQFGLIPRRRGRWTWPGAFVFFKTRLGLMAYYRPIAAIPLKVYPALLHRTPSVLDPQLLMEQWGVKTNRRFKADQEFESLRPYQPGDDYRSIDWKASARMRQLITRQFQVAHHHQIMVCIDKSRLMGTLNEGVRKIDWAIEATLHLGHLAKRFEDRIGVMVFDDEIHQWSKPRPSAVPVLLEQVFDVDCELVEPNYPLLCGTLLQNLRKRSLVIILSDFMDASSLEPSMEAFRRLNQRHCTLFIGIEDPVYQRYLKPKPYATPQGVVKHIIAQDSLARRQTAIQQLRRQGLYALTATPATLTQEAMKAYTTIKYQGAIG